MSFEMRVWRYILIQFRLLIVILLYLIFDQMKIDLCQTITDTRNQNQTPKSAILPMRKISLSKRFSEIQKKSDSLILWRQSSSSLSRDRSPSHKIPTASRFLSSRDSQSRNQQFVQLNLRQQIGNPNSIRFPQSKRPEHFVKVDKVHTPSPASYNISSFLEKQGQELFLNSIYKENPENSRNYISGVKGVTIPAFKAYHKSYIHHSQHRPYQPESTRDVPGPGQYENTFIHKKMSKSYSIRKNVNKPNNTIHHPGPRAYNNISERLKSINMKGTIPNSKRTYLIKFQNNPGPHDYHISRFLDQYS